LAGEAYYEDGKRIEFTEENTSLYENFCTTSNWILIYEFGGKGK